MLLHRPNGHPTALVLANTMGDWSVILRCIYIVEYRWMRVYPKVCRGRQQIATTMSILCNPPRSGMT
jgi:hypothetical protein